MNENKMYLNTTNEKNLRREWQELIANDTVDINVNVKWLTPRICIPLKNGTDQVTATFKTMTCKDFWEIDSKATQYIPNPIPHSMNMNEFQAPEVRNSDHQEFRHQIVRNMLRKISICKLKLDKKGKLTKGSYEQVMNFPAPLISALVDKYYEMINLTTDEEKEIDQQSMQLFAKNSRGVENACEAVSLFCALSSFWDKFGINRFDFKKLSYKEYIMLRIMLSKETMIHSAQMRTEANRSNSKVSFGGKSMPSRGIVMRDDGSQN